MTETNFNPFDSISQRLSRIESTLALIVEKQPEKKFYPVAEAAERLGVAPITLYRGAESGKIPHKRVGSRLMIPGSFIEK